MKRVFKQDFKITQTYNNKHKGLDIVGIGDINIISPIEGTVKTSTIIKDKSNLTWEWGNYVRVDDKNGNRYYFCHLKSRNVYAGDKVKIGDVLGVMGNTGKSFGSHLHFETRDAHNQRMNPCSFLEIPNEVRKYYLKNKWQLILNKWYYFNADRQEVKGFFKVKNKPYYFAETDYKDIKKYQLITTNTEGEIL